MNVEVRGKLVVHRGRRGKERQWPRDRVATVLHAPQVPLGAPQDSLVSYLVLLDRRGRLLLRLSSVRGWPKKEVARLCRQLKEAESVLYPAGTKPRTIRRGYRRALPVVVTHGWAVAVLGTVVIFAAAAGWTVAFGR